MSSKNKFINSIREARTQQLKWLSQVKLTVSGVFDEKKAVPVNQSECGFSEWLYNDAMVFSTSRVTSVLDEMAELHTQCYDVYLKIYSTLFASNKSGIMAVFGTKRAGASDLKLAQNYYEELVDISDKLINRLRTFESQMLAMPEAKFDELMIEAESDTVAAEAPATVKSTDSVKNKIYFRGRLIEG